jgi:hypothetical protein
VIEQWFKRSDIRHLIICTEHCSELYNLTVKWKFTVNHLIQPEFHAFSYVHPTTVVMTDAVMRHIRCRENQKVQHDILSRNLVFHLESQITPSILTKTLLTWIQITFHLLLFLFSKFTITKNFGAEKTLRWYGCNSTRDKCLTIQDKHVYWHTTLRVNWHAFLCLSDAKEMYVVRQKKEKKERKKPA